MSISEIVQNKLKQITKNLNGYHNDQPFFTFAHFQIRTLIHIFPNLQ